MSNHFGLSQQLLELRDVARELGTTAEQLVPLATSLAMHVSCPSSVLTVDQADHLEAAWHSRALQ